MKTEITERCCECGQTVYTPTRAHVSCAADVAKLCKAIHNSDTEFFRVYVLDNQMTVLHFEDITHGSPNSAHVRIADIFRPAVLRSATRIICVHNHPAGATGPSPEDRSLTKKIQQAGALLNIQLLDHIILARGHSHPYSFAESGDLA